MPDPVLILPEDAGKALEEGKWLTYGVGLPDYLKDAKDGFHTVASTLVTLLDIALAALRLAKALNLSYLDPLTAMLDAIIRELQGYLNDIRQGGLYFSSDYKYFEPPFDELRGGYSTYERRMVARFLDPSDPTRPNFSSASSVGALFVYSEADLTSVMNIIRLVKLFMKYFNQDIRPRSLPIVSNLKVAYGLDDMNAFDFFRSLGDYFNTDAYAGKVPNVARVSWNANITPNSPGLNLPSLTVGGYLIHVSTVRDGLPIFYERTVGNVPKAEQPDGSLITQRITGRVLDPNGQPLTLYGGADQIADLEGNLGFNTNIVNSVLRPGAARVFAKKSQADAAAIPLEQLRDGDDYLFQKTFFLTAAQAAFYPGDGFGFPLSYDKMPFDADVVQNSNGTVTLNKKDRPLSYYVRITPVSTKVEAVSSFKFGLSSATMDAPTPYKAQAYGTGSDGNALAMGTDYGRTSDALPILFPSVNTRTYLDRVALAIAVLVLSRSDLPISPDGSYVRGTAKTLTGLEAFGSLVRWVYPGPSDTFGDPDVLPDTFRKDLWKRCRQMAYDMYQRTGPMPAIEEFVVDQTELLEIWTWHDGNSDLSETVDLDVGGVSLQVSNTIKESLQVPGLINDVDGPFEGLALNPWCLAAPDIANATFYTQYGPLQAREPGFSTAPSTRVLVKEAYARSEIATVLAGYPLFAANIEADMASGAIPRNSGTGLYTLPPALRSLPNVESKTEGSADHSPVYYVDLAAIQAGNGGKMFYCRNLFPPEIYRQAAVALNIAASSFGRRTDKGEWIALRPFQTLPDLFQYLDMIVSWAQGLSAGLKSIADGLDAYIEFLEARILEIQQLIRRIDALVQSIEVIQIPSFSGLMVWGNGTEGVLSKFLAAPDKPGSSGSDVYGAGLVVVTGGIPAVLLDLLLFRA